MFVEFQSGMINEFKVKIQLVGVSYDHEFLAR
jgi:hypothetical protein